MSTPHRLCLLKSQAALPARRKSKYSKTLNAWVAEQGLPRGILSYDFADTETGEQKAVFDLAWPNGIQQELSQPVAVLLNEDAEVIVLASSAGYRCFTSPMNFRQYVENEVLSKTEHV